MLIGAGAISALVFGLLAYAFWRSDRPVAINENLWLIGGGLVFPSVTLLALLSYALLSGERLIARDDPDILTVEAVASQFQWEFRYPDRPGAGSSPVLVIPVHRAVNVRVTSADVIHSFWVPRLAGKIDAIPGHVNVIRIRTDRAGIYRGQCSEFCGHGHATMHFHIEAVPETEFAGFLTARSVAHLEDSSRKVAP
jgi:cytochrome c oxidase subunit 2